MSGLAGRRRGRIELGTARSLRDMARVHAAHDALAESALALARTLDEGAGLATAAVARELRATLTTLAEGGSDANDAVAELVAVLSSPVGDAPQS